MSKRQPKEKLGNWECLVLWFLLAEQGAAQRLWKLQSAGSRSEGQEENGFNLFKVTSPTLTIPLLRTGKLRTGGPVW